jgi:HEAT repeat protein
LSFRRRNLPLDCWCGFIVALIVWCHSSTVVAGSQSDYADSLNRDPFETLGLAAIEINRPIRFRERYRVLALASRLWIADPEPHLRAIRTISRTGLVQGAFPLISELSDEFSPYRAEAATALARLPHPAAVSPLSRALASPDFGLRKEASLALGSLIKERVLDAEGEANVIEKLSDLLKWDSELQVRHAAYRALISSGSEKGLLLALGSASADPRYLGFVLHCTFLKDLGYLSEVSGEGSSIQKALRIIQPALKKDPLLIRFTLLRVYLLSRYSCASPRVGAARGLGLLRDPGSVPELARISKFDRDVALRAAAVTSLGKIGGETAFVALTEAMEDGNAKVRRATMEALVELGDRRAGEALARILGKGSAYDRLGAATALLRFPGHSKELIHALRDNVAQVRRAAELALLENPDPDAVPMLIDALSSPDKRQRAGAMRVLATYMGEESRLHLVEVLRRGELPSASLAAFALGLRGEPESRKELERVLTVSNYPDPLTIVHALQDLNQPESIPVLRSFEESASDPKLRAAAKLAAMVLENAMELDR